MTDKPESNYVPQYSRAGVYSNKSAAPTTVVDRRERFGRVLKVVQDGGGWLVSPPGAEECRMECLPGSTLPDDLREKGYTVTADGEGTRILPHAVTEDILVEGSTRPTRRVTHAGIVPVDRFKFNLP